MLPGENSGTSMDYIFYGIVVLVAVLVAAVRIRDSRREDPQ